MTDHAACPEPDASAPFDGEPPSADRIRADALARFEHDTAFLARIVPLFSRAAREQSRALLDALERGDADGARHWAHTLKGSLLTVGADPSAGRAAQIERQACDGRLEGTASLARRLAAETETIIEALGPAA